MVRFPSLLRKYSVKLTTPVSKTIETLRAKLLMTRWNVTVLLKSYFLLRLFISLVSYADDSVDLVFCDNWQEEDTSKGRKGMQTRGKTIRGCENGKASCTGHSDKDNKRQSESVELQEIVVEKSSYFCSYYFCCCSKSLRTTHLAEWCHKDIKIGTFRHHSLHLNQ